MDLHVRTLWRLPSVSAGDRAKVSREPKNPEVSGARSPQRRKQALAGDR